MKIGKIEVKECDDSHHINLHDKDNRFLRLLSVKIDDNDNKLSIVMIRGRNDGKWDEFEGTRKTVAEYDEFKIQII